MWPPSMRNGDTSRPQTNLGILYGSRIYLAVRIFAEYLVRLGRCVTKIRLLLYRVDRNSTSSKRTNLYAYYVLIVLPFILSYTGVM